MSITEVVQKQHLILRLQADLDEKSTVLQRLNESFQEKYAQISGFQFFVQTLTGKKLCLQAKGSFTLLMMKHLIFLREGIPINQQRWIHAGVQLDDSQTLDNSKISPETTVHLVLRLRGGMFASQNGRYDYDSSNHILDNHIRILQAEIDTIDKVIPELESFCNN